MFAKVFGQIFDSSIAEDYNCRRMFMDLLVLADPTGAVDMTPEAIARRTNVPLPEVVKYIEELCQPDRKSRSPLEEGKRLIPLDSKRDWGWQIVNYGHYRKLKDQEALRTYFRDAQRRRRAKKENVKDKSLTGVDKVGHALTNLDSPSSSTSSFLEELKRNPFNAGVDIDLELEKAKAWCKRKGRRCTERFFRGWVDRADRVIIEPKKPTVIQEPLTEQDKEWHKRWEEQHGTKKD